MIMSLTVCNDVHTPSVHRVCLMLTAAMLSQVHMGSLGREASGSPILVTENVTSATTHVTKVKKQKQNLTAACEFRPLISSV